MTVEQERERIARAHFLAGEGTLTVGQVQAWAAEMGREFELDGCKDPEAFTLMVSTTEVRGGDPGQLGVVLAALVMRDLRDRSGVLDDVDGETELEMEGELAGKIAAALGKR